MSASRLAGCAAFTMASWVLEAGMLLAAARALGIELSLGSAAGVTALAVISQVVQVTPGGIGVYELSMSAALALGGIAPEQALALAVVTHTLNYAYTFTFGAAFAVPSAVLSRTSTSRTR